MLDTQGMRTRDRGPQHAARRRAADQSAAHGGAPPADAAGSPSTSGRAAVTAVGGSVDRRVVAGALSGRRLLVAVALALLLPGSLAAAALHHADPESPPARSATRFAELAQLPDQVFRSQLERSQRVIRLSGKLTVPTLLDPVATGSAGPGALPTLALPPRAAPYSLDELRHLVPAAFSDLIGLPNTGGPLVLNANLQVPVGAILVIDGRTPDVRLTSTTSGFATIFSRGTVSITGDAARPVRISSWDTEHGRIDLDPSDGRSFIVQIGGRMDADHAVFEYLGFNLGLSSGVAWSGTSANSVQPQYVKVRGDVRSSIFRHNYFGAYTTRAEGMQWVGNTFADNEEYGFDPHTFSNNFLVDSNVAEGNGKHGFIFSRGCTNNILRGNISHRNGGHGFMIDDGRSLDSNTAESRINASNDNQILSNQASDNIDSGIEIEGGTGNIVAGNQVAGNYIGIRVKDNAGATVRDNMITDNLRYGVDVLNDVGNVPIDNNTISASWGAISLATASNATVGANVVSDVSASMVIAGTAIPDKAWIEKVVTLVRWNPMLVLWSLLLGVPIVVVLGRFLWTAARPTRRTRIS